jgi:hypothetical protein
MFDFRSVRTPKTMTTAEESDDPGAVEGRILEKAGLYEEAVHLVDELFRMFLKRRISADWQQELVGIRAWIQQAA